MSRFTTSTLAHWLFLVAIISLAQPTGYRGLDRVTLLGFPLSTIHNLGVLAGACVAALGFGLRRRFSPILAATFALLVMSFTVSTRPEFLTLEQTLRTFFALSLAPLLFEIRYPPTTQKHLKRVLPWFASLNLALSLVGAALIGNSLVRIDMGALRLTGTIVPAGVAALGLVGVMFSLLAARTQPRWLWLAMFNYLIVAWTGTRLATVNGAILCFGWIVSELRHRPIRAKTTHLVTVGVLVPLLALSYAPFMATRWSATGGKATERIVLAHPNQASATEESEVDDGGERSPQATIQISTMGRLGAWKHFYDLAEENLIFGRGLGTGVAGGVDELGRAFRLPHNEYLRVLVDGGIVGLLFLTGAYLWTVVAVARRASRSNRVLVAAAFFVLATQAALTNALAAQSFIVPFWLYLCFLDYESHP